MKISISLPMLQKETKLESGQPSLQWMMAPYYPLSSASGPILTDLADSLKLLFHTLAILNLLTFYKFLGYVPGLGYLYQQVKIVAEK